VYSLNQRIPHGIFPQLKEYIGSKREEKKRKKKEEYIGSETKEQPVSGGSCLLGRVRVEGSCSR
jgi:hypothetical protein